MIQTALIITFLFSGVVYADPIEWCPFCNGERQRDWTAAAERDFLSGTHNPFTDIPVLSSEHFVAYITKGAFVPHYFLIVSKEHFERIADLPADYIADLEKLKSFFETYYAQVLKTKFIAFEHGPLPACRAGGGGGGCIDHLHLHMVPFARGSISERLIQQFPGEFGPPIKLPELRALTGPALDGQSYIYVQENTGEMIAFPVTGQIPSQLMRMIVAGANGYDEEWNWREFIGRGDFLVNSMMTFTPLALYRELGAERAADQIDCHRLMTKY